MENKLDAMDVMIICIASIMAYVGTMMCCDMIARKLPRERMSIFIIMVAGSVAMSILLAPAGFKWQGLVWIIFVIVFGWITHRFVGS